MTTLDPQLLQKTEQYIQGYFSEHISTQFVFHDLEHTVQTVAAAKIIGEGYELSEREMTLLLLAAWFHDSGYSGGQSNHEERSVGHAKEFLNDALSAADLKLIESLILSTKVPQEPDTLMEQVLCDADLSHLGMDSYWDRNGKLRQEFILTKNNIMSEQEWIDFEINFMLTHEYHTAVAQEMFNKRKGKHIQQLLKQKRRLNPGKAPTVQEITLMDEKDKSGSLNHVLQESANEIKMARFGRGVETMYRTTYRTHTNLSAMADSKANLMLSVNAIVISILVSSLLPRLVDKPTIQLIIPTILLTCTCLGSMVYATLATRPHVTEGKVTKEAIKSKKANLLFFGNFYNMQLEEFQWGVNEMLKDPEFLYSSMSRDLFFLGIVLAKKYKYLSICYNIFMYGLIISVAGFALCFAFIR
jgi:predicted metal-dependent HD superfamily phosphohydrolase